jgi:hypothetical protein
MKRERRTKKLRSAPAPSDRNEEEPGLVRARTGKQADEPADIVVRNLNQATARERLASAVEPVYKKHRDEIEKLKEQGRKSWDRPDWIWESLLEAFATWGNSDGVELVRNPEFRNPIRYRDLLPLTADKQLEVLTRSLRGAKVRWSDRKAPLLIANLRRIQTDGGPDAVKAKLEALPGREKKIEFLKSFRGVGAKYARNIMMIACHPEFYDCVAVDSRVNSVVGALGLEFGNNYKAEEQFLVSAAKSASINGWELDRVLYWFNDEVLDSIR